MVYLLMITKSQRKSHSPVQCLSLPTNGETGTQIILPHSRLYVLGTQKVNSQPYRNLHSGHPVAV